jgi:hypothetical protein
LHGVTFGLEKKEPIHNARRNKKCGGRGDENKKIKKRKKER